MHIAYPEPLRSSTLFRLMDSVTGNGIFEYVNPKKNESQVEGGGLAFGDLGVTETNPMLVTISHLLGGEAIR